MVTVDMPKYTINEKDYRVTKKGHNLSHDLLGIMENIAIKNNILYAIL